MTSEKLLGGRKNFWNSSIRELDNILTCFAFCIAHIMTRFSFGMPKRGEKLGVVVTIKMTEEDKRNLENDIPLLNEKLRRNAGDEIDASKFVRGAIRYLHYCLGKDIVPAWLAMPEVMPKKRKPKI